MCNFHIRIAAAILFVLVAAETKSITRKLPAGIIACSRDDPALSECALRSMQAAIPALAKGDPRTGLPSMDPMLISEVRLEDPGSSPHISVDVVIRHLEVHGGKDTKVKTFKLDLKTGELKYTALVPKLVLLGRYAGSGRILFMPIKGTGQLNITLENVVYSFAAKFSTTRKGGIEKLLIEDTSLDFSPENAFIRLENLFNGDKKLEDHMNHFLTENWKEMVDDIGTSASEIFRSSLDQELRIITSKVSYDTLFPPTSTPQTVPQENVTQDSTILESTTPESTTQTEDSN